MASKISENLFREPRENKLADALTVAVITNQMDLSFAQGGFTDSHVPDFIPLSDFLNDVFLCHITIYFSIEAVSIEK